MRASQTPPRRLAKFLDVFGHFCAVAKPALARLSNNGQADRLQLRSLSKPSVASASGVRRRSCWLTLALELPKSCRGEPDGLRRILLCPRRHWLCVCHCSHDQLISGRVRFAALRDLNQHLQKWRFSGGGRRRLGGRRVGDIGVAERSPTVTLLACSWYETRDSREGTAVRASAYCRSTGRLIPARG